MSENKKYLPGVSAIQKRFQKLAFGLSESASMAAVVETSARDDNREAVIRKLGKLIPERFRSVQLIRGLPENTGILFRLIQEGAVITLRITGQEVGLELSGFLLKDLPAARKDLILTPTHAAQLFKTHAEQFFQA